MRGRRQMRLDIKQPWKSEGQIMLRCLITIGTATFLVLAVGNAFAGSDTTTLRLDGNPNAATMTLEYSGDADTSLTCWCWRPFYWRPYPVLRLASAPFRYWGPRYYYGSAFRGPARYPGLYAAQFRNSYGDWAPNRGFGLGFRAAPAYASNPVSYDVPASTVYGSTTPPRQTDRPITVLNNSPRKLATPSSRELVPAPRATTGDGTFQYDGDPTNRVPMPKDNPGPNRGSGSRVLDARLASPPSASSRYVYLAYGEKPQPVVQPANGVFRVALEMVQR
jgi:hypothetical protein